MRQISPRLQKLHSNVLVNTQNKIYTVNQQSIIKLDPTVEQEAVCCRFLHLGRAGCFWEISQVDYRYKKSFLWLSNPLMSVPSNSERTLLRLPIKVQVEGLQQSKSTVREEFKAPIALVRFQTNVVME